MTAARMGFIGLGLMGQGFTRRLIETGHHVVGFDIDAAKVQAAAKLGVTPAMSAADVANSVDIILVSVIDTNAVEDVALGPQGCDCSGQAGGKGPGRPFDDRIDRHDADRCRASRARRSIRRCARVRWAGCGGSRDIGDHGGRR